MNVAANAPNLEAPGASSRAAKSEVASRAFAPRAAAGLTSHSKSTPTAHPFFSLLNWLTNEVVAADVADSNTHPPKKEDKTRQHDTQAILPIELPKTVAQIKPPIALDQTKLVESGVASKDPTANTEQAASLQTEPVATSAVFETVLTKHTPIALDQANLVGSRVASTDQTANTEQTAPIQAKPVATSTITPAPLAFGAVLTEHTPTPKEVMALPKSSAIPQGSSVNGTAFSQNVAELKPGITAASTDTQAGRDDSAEHTKDAAREKLVRTPAGAELQAHAPIVSEATDGKLERPQNPPSIKSELSDTPKAELKTEINTVVRPQPTREISLKLTGADAGSVDVRISERAGKVQVDVRTSDGVLARSLRSDLGDLVGRLEKQGFDAHTWTPGGQPASAPGSSSRSDAHSDQESQRFQGGSGQQGQNQNQDGRQKHNPRLEFLQKFESSMSFDTSSSIPDGNKENYVNTGN